MSIWFQIMRLWFLYMETSQKQWPMNSDCDGIWQLAKQWPMNLDCDGTWQLRGGRT